MEGVILFVDDKIDDYTIEENAITRTIENALFEELRLTHPVLGVKSLEQAENVIKSVGSFNALILDWIFDERDEMLEAGENRALIRRVAQPDRANQTLEFLKKNDFYSLVYIFSNEDVNAEYGDTLRKKYKKRIRFKRKNGEENQASAIAKDIIAWKRKNTKLSIPAVWTKTINQSVQKILLELSEADQNWIKELGKSASDDGVSGEIFVIEILQYLLTESLVDNGELIEIIKEHIEGEDTGNPTDKRSVAKLFNRLFYTPLNPNSPIMTGDICNLGKNKFGIIITPECNIKDTIRDETRELELLTFTRNSFDTFLSQPTNYEYRRNLYGQWSGTNNGRRNLVKLKQRFNNGDDARFHILPSFPFNKRNLHLSAVIDLSRGCERFKADDIKNTRSYKLNSPFIQQLRQRYIAYFGRIGVPSLADAVRSFNLGAR